MIDITLWPNPMISRYPDGSKCFAINLYFRRGRHISLHVDPKLTHTGVTFSNGEYESFIGRMSQRIKDLRKDWEE